MFGTGVAYQGDRWKEADSQAFQGLRVTLLSRPKGAPLTIADLKAGLPSVGENLGGNQIRTL